MPLEPPQPPRIRKKSVVRGWGRGRPGGGPGVLGVVARRLAAAPPGRTSGMRPGNTSGMGPGNVAVVAAQSGVGRSTFALNAAVAAVKTGALVMFSLLEMSSTELMQKIAAAEGRDPLHYLTHQGGLTAEGWETVRRLGPELFQFLPLRVYRPDGEALGDIASAARACARADGLGLLVVDYLQEAEVGQFHTGTRRRHSARHVDQRALEGRKPSAPRPGPHLPRGPLHNPYRPSPARHGRPAQSRHRRPPPGRASA
ncbi:DnaB-like helicase C-terminal domain-containing protein [Streptomyces flaveolus]|uniref:DnaB-like helicase C-terminal domain-containing protein n=1 Tax=Streptomyces flaveolus TaxID=67297 RepID=UPI0034218DD8